MSTMTTNPGTVASGTRAETGHCGDIDGEYRQLVLDRIEERGLVIDHDVDGRATRMAKALSHQSCSPADVVEIHVRTLRRLTVGADAARATALLDAGEHVLLLILGRLADEYRLIALAQA